MEITVRSLQLKIQSSVGVGGTYYVTATTTDGTNCSRTLSIEVEESEIATVTLDDITVQDLNKR